MTDHEQTSLVADPPPLPQDPAPAPAKPDPLFSFPKTMPGQLSMGDGATGQDSDTPELHGVRWGSMLSPRGRFHLAPRDGLAICGHRFPQTHDGIGNAWLAPVHVAWARSEGMICKRCESAR